MGVFVGYDDVVGEREFEVVFEYYVVRCVDGGYGCGVDGVYYCVNVVEECVYFLDFGGVFWCCVLGRDVLKGFDECLVGGFW